MCLSKTNFSSFKLITQHPLELNDNSALGLIEAK